MKTAMQEFINDTLEGKAKELEHYIEKEKQMIIDAYIKCEKKHHNLSLSKSNLNKNTLDRFKKDAEQYYNETFKQ